MQPVPTGSLSARNSCFEAKPSSVPPIPPQFETLSVTVNGVVHLNQWNLYGFQPWWLMIPGFFFKFAPPEMMKGAFYLHLSSCSMTFQHEHCFRHPTRHRQRWERQGLTEEGVKGPRDWQKLWPNVTNYKIILYFVNVTPNLPGPAPGAQKCPPWCWKLGAKYHQNKCRTS